MEYNNSLYYGIIYGEELASYIADALKTHPEYSALIGGELITDEFTLEASNNPPYFYIYCPGMSLWGANCDSIEGAVARFNPMELIKLEAKNGPACAAISALYAYIVEYLRGLRLVPKVYITWYSIVLAVDSL